MDKYYYLAAQLPFLQFGKSTSIDREGFLREAEKWLDEKDFSLLRQADINNFTPLEIKNTEGQKLTNMFRGEERTFLTGFNQSQNRVKIWGDYREFEANLRNELSRLRKALREGQEYKLPGVLSRIVSEGNPLDIEKKLLHLRWKFIEEKEEGHYFDLEFLISYFLKLQILERLFIFNKEKGMVAFDRLCEANLESRE